MLRFSFAVMDASSTSSSSDHSQSNQKKRNESCPSFQENDAPLTQDLDTEHRSVLGAVPELPQCKMGSKKVDDMSFMISCTNWY